MIAPPIADCTEGASPSTHQTNKTPNTVSMGIIKLTSGAGIYRGANMSSVKDKVSKTDKTRININSCELSAIECVKGKATNAVTRPENAIAGVMSQFRACRVVTNVAARKIDVKTANGIVRTALYRVKETRFGQQQLNDIEVIELPENEGNTVGFDGLLGMNILSKYDFILDQDAGLLELKRLR